MSIEQPDSNLFVWRSAIDSSLAADAAAELEIITKDQSFIVRSVGTTGGDSPSGGNEAATVTTYHDIPPAMYRVYGYNACAALVGSTGNIQGAMTAFNLQDSFATQKFHQDFGRHAVVVAHLNEGGAFDWASQILDCDEQTTQIARSIEVNQGDVVVQLNPEQPHRGRNTSDLVRFTFSAYI